MVDTHDIDFGDGRSLHAVQAGRGADVVLIHGALATAHDMLAGTFEHLSRRFRVTAIDRPGHGRSRRPRLEGTPRDQADIIAEGLARIGVERAVLVGHSFGGLVSLAVAERHSDRVSALVLLAPLVRPELRLVEHSFLAPRAIPLFGPWISMAARISIDRPALAAIQRVMFHPQPVPDAWQRSFPYEAVLSTEAMLREGEDAAAILPGSIAGIVDLAAIRVPVRIMGGSDDKIVDHNGQGRALAQLLPDAQFEEVEGQGHMLHHFRPDLVVAAVDAALGKAEA